MYFVMYLLCNYYYMYFYNVLFYFLPVDIHVFNFLYAGVVESHSPAVINLLLFAGVYVLTYLANRVERQREIAREEMFIMVGK